MKCCVLLSTAVLVAYGSPILAEPPLDDAKIGDPVAIVTHSGRTLRGELDPRTDGQFVWLTATCDGVAISSRTARSDIQRINHAAPVELPPLWQDASSSGESLPQQNAVTTEAACFGHDLTKVSSLEVAATMANWDSDSNLDGVRLWVQPLGRDGLVTPVSGTVRAELLLEEPDMLKFGEFRVVEAWSEAIDAAEFSAEGVTLELPLRRVKPESRLDRFPLAVLRVRLNVPSEGSFDAVVTDLPLRPLSWNRDQQQHITGGRTLPGEPSRN